METDYLRSVISNVQDTIPELIECIQKSKVKFDAILCKCVSGMIPASIVGYLMKVPVVFVRKETDSSHSSYKIEGNHYQRYIIIDDLIFSGDTINSIIDAANNLADKC